MENKKEDTLGYLKNNILFLLALLLVSIGANLYQFNNTDKMITTIDENKTNKLTQDDATTQTISSPYGFRSEMVTTFDGKDSTTYSTSSPLTKEDVDQIHNEILEKQKAMEDYFKKQEEYFRDFWRMF